MSKRTLSALLAAATLGLGATAARAEQPGQADLQKQLAELQQQVNSLKAQQAAAPVSAYNAKDVAAAVESVMKDADARSKALAETGGFYGGWQDDKFTIRSADGNYDLSPGIQFQARYISNYNQAAAGDRTDSGFDVRRLKLSFDGHAITPKLYYNFVWATLRRGDTLTTSGAETATTRGGGLYLEEAYVQYQFADNFAIKGGQWKEYIYHEQIVSSKRQIAVDRSLVNEVLNQGESYLQGVDLLWDNKSNMRADIAFTDGYNSQNTTFQDPAVNPFDFGVNGRFEFAAIGGFKGYNQFTSLGNKTDVLVFGAGADWSQGDNLNVYHGNADVQWNSGPFGVYAALVVLYTDTSGGGRASSFDYGAVIQGNYLINQTWEAFARYDYMRLDGGDSFITHGTESTFHEITVGLNYYLKGHQAKFTVDAGWLPNGAPNNQEGAGILSNDGSNEFYLRAQFQLLI